MQFRRVKDVAAISGTYQDNQGQTKNRYVNVGVVMKGDDGNSFILLNRTFNPAGITPKNPNDDKILLSLFDPRDDNGRTPSAAPAAAAAPRAPAPVTGDDDIPF